MTALHSSGQLDAIIWLRQGRKVGREVRFLCPAHDDHHPSARWNRSKAVWHCDACGAGGGALDLSSKLGLLPSASPPIRRLTDYAGHGTVAKVAKAANPGAGDAPLRIWEATTRGDGTLVGRYLASRGIACEIPSSLRFLPRLRHAPTGCFLPAMVAGVVRWPNITPCAIHRTYLSADGGAKADVEPCRMALGPTRGGAVRLAAAGRSLAVAEGIETALSIQLASGMPAWATLSASNLKNLVLPTLQLAAEVLIGADADAAGRHGAYVAAELWSRQGRRVRIALPPEGSDFNDLMRGSQ